MSPNVNDLKKSKFLTQFDVDPAVLATITSYEQVNVAMEGAEPDERWTLSFNELEKPLVVNSTNGQIIAAIIGSGEFEDWIGLQIVLYRDPTIAFHGKIVGGIRVRAPKIQSAKANPAMKPATKTLSPPNSDIPF
jgi:hypothetical protein